MHYLAVLILKALLMIKRGEGKFHPNILYLIDTGSMGGNKGLIYHTIK
jgi:hypothetical protein